MSKSCGTRARPAFQCLAPAHIPLTKTSHVAGDTVKLGGAAKCMARGMERARVRSRVFLSAITAGHLRQVT